MPTEAERWEKHDRHWREWTEARERRWEAWAESRGRGWEERERGWQELSQELREAAEGLWDEQRRYNDALLDRHARITADQIAAIAEINRRSEANFVALQSEIAEQRAEIREQTQALMRMLDRLPPREG